MDDAQAVALLEEVSVRFGWPPGEAKLEVGAGYNATPGYLHADINPNVQPDWCGSVEALPAAWSGLFAEVMARDILEHLSWQDTSLVLAEWRRVLRPNGRLYVQVPDAGTIMREYSTQPPIVSGLEAWPPIVSTAWKLLGGHHDGTYAADGDDWRWNAHAALFDEPSLRWYLESAGFWIQSLTRNAHPNLLCWAVAR